MPRLSTTDKMTTLRQRQAEIANQLKLLEAREKEQVRRDDSRRKIIAGALALEHAEKNPDDAFSKKLFLLLDEYVLPRNRGLFPNLPAKGINERGGAAQAGS